MSPADGDAAACLLRTLEAFLRQTAKGGYDGRGGEACLQVERGAGNQRFNDRAAERMDTYFISHGDPMAGIDESFAVRELLKSWRKQTLRHVPKSILVVSGHWETSDPTVNVFSGPNPTIHDFDRRPERHRLFQIQYPAPGAPKLAKRVKELLIKSGFNNVNEDETRGLDHGAWIPLMLMYPEANIPVCQLSVQPQLDATHHFNMGRALCPLREEGVLIIGSGAATHNLDIVGPDDGSILPWASEFDAWLKECLLNGRYEDIIDYEEKAPHAKIAHPWPEHLYPIHVALGAAGEEAKAELIHHSWQGGSLSYASYRFITKK
ncbi:hypothetical protein Scep_002926 [Stephania cephalantha]|uniref:Extradiol ring-cleavage dioxygenase class III enzyme subunit B domain-containing protein n=1 Tax=Stephania cephalantha TaxID=152367 RepID=A0AAP0LBX5_9MAGN